MTEFEAAPSEIFLLGAGASKDAGLPTSYELTARFLGDSSPVLDRDLLGALRYLGGGLLFQQGAKGYDPFGGADVEQLFEVIQQVRDRQDSPLNPFVSSWSRELETIVDPLSPADAAAVERAVEHAMPFRQGYDYKVSVRAVVDGIMVAQNRDSQRRPEKLRHEMLVGLRKLLEVDASRIEYLKDFVCYAMSKSAPIVTLNYDTSIEMAAEARAVQIDLGVHDDADLSVSFAPGPLPLVKLHGSANWFPVAGDGSLADRVTAIGLRFGEPITRADEPVVIFGGASKLTAQQPFFELFLAFRDYLTRASHLTVIGYSFRDSHINRTILDWLHGNRTRTMEIVDPQPIEGTFWLMENKPELWRMLQAENQVTHNAVTAKAFVDSKTNPYASALLR